MKETRKKKPQIVRERLDAEKISPSAAHRPHTPYATVCASCLYDKFYPVVTRTDTSGTQHETSRRRSQDKVCFMGPGARFYGRRCRAGVVVASRRSSRKASEPGAVFETKTSFYGFVFLWFFAEPRSLFFGLSAALEIRV